MMKFLLERARAARKRLDGISALVPIGATLIGAAISFKHVAQEVKIADFGISLLTAVIAALAGALSVYIARASKSLSHQRRIFISYSRDEQDRARKLRDMLSEGGAKVWFDDYVLEPGDDWRSRINAAIENSNTFIAIISSDYKAHVEAELQTALDRHVPVVAYVTNELTAHELPEARKIQILKPGTDLKALAGAALAAR